MPLELPIDPNGAHSSDFLRGHGDLTPFFHDVLVDLERSCYLVIGRFGFAPRGERHVHHNHVVGAVRLIRVDG